MDAPNTALTRRAAISWFTTTQASKIMRDGAIPDWFHGIISRRDAEELLKDKSLGCFLIRVGESRIGFSLSYRGLDRCRHFIIDVTAGGQYNISGDSNVHQTLQDLVTFHTRVPIVPYTECLTVPCGQVSHVNADYEELCIFVPTRKKQNSPTPHSCSSAGSCCPTTSHSASNNWTADLPKQAAIRPPIPPKGHCSRLSPPPLPHRRMTDLKPIPEPKGMTNEPTLLSGRLVVKRLYPSLRVPPTTMSMEQQPTPEVTVSGPQRNQHSNAEMGIRDSHISSGRDVSDSKSEFKHQTNAAGNVYSRHPNPIPTQRQPADHMTDTNSLAPALKYTDYSPSTGSRCDQLTPAPRSPLHLPRTTHGQSGSHSPALHSKIIPFIRAEPVRRCQPLTGCAEGEIREHESGRVDLPAEYMIPPPYAPGYQPSEKIEQKMLK